MSIRIKTTPTGCRAVFWGVRSGIAQVLLCSCCLVICAMVLVIDNTTHLDRLLAFKHGILVATRGGHLGISVDAVLLGCSHTWPTVKQGSFHL